MMGELCDHCGQNEKEFRRKLDCTGEGYCLECLLDHGEPTEELEAV